MPFLPLITRLYKHLSHRKEGASFEDDILISIEIYSRYNNSSTLDIRSERNIPCIFPVILQSHVHVFESRNGSALSRDSTRLMAAGSNRSGRPVCSCYRRNARKGAGRHNFTLLLPVKTRRRNLPPLFPPSARRVSAGNCLPLVGRNAGRLRPFHTLWVLFFWVYRNIAVKNCTDMIGRK